MDACFAVVAMKVRKALDDAQRGAAVARGVSGSLAEMGLPDVIQVLSNGRKSGKLQIRAGGRTGEIYFRDGQVFDAHFGAANGAEAVYAMILLHEGDFVLDPGVVPDFNRVQLSSESLLLEGMRRMDEGRR